MFTYSSRSQQALDTCHPDLIKVFTKILDYRDCTIICGHRGKAEQNQCCADGLTKLRYPHSKHNTTPSMAVDAVPYFNDLRNTDWRDAAAFGLFAGRVLQITQQLFEDGQINHLIRWGGDWDADGRTNDHAFRDLPHFELYVPGDK